MKTMPTNDGINENMNVATTTTATTTRSKGICAISAKVHMFVNNMPCTYIHVNIIKVTQKMRACNVKAEMVENKVLLLFFFCVKVK